MNHDAQYLINQAKQMRNRNTTGPVAFLNVIEKLDCQLNVPGICITHRTDSLYDERVVIPVPGCWRCIEKLNQWRSLEEEKGSGVFLDYMTDAALRTWNSLYEIKAVRVYYPHHHKELDKCGNR